MNLAGTFWLLAHKRYQTRKPIRGWETAAFIWSGLAAVIYGGALLIDFSGNMRFIPPGLIAVGLPLVLGVLHRKIRLEQSKGPDALYRKRLAAGR